MNCQISINFNTPPFKVVSININQTCLGMSSASVTLSPDVNDPLTTQEISDLLGAPVQISWPVDDNLLTPEKQFNGFVDELLPSVSGGQQFIGLRILTDSERLQTSPWLRIFTNKSLNNIVDKIAADNNRTIQFLGANPSVHFSIQQYEDDISYLSRLAEEYGKIFFDDGQQLRFIDWAGFELAIDIESRVLNHIDMTLNLLPCNLELHGRLNNGSEQQNLSTIINSPGVEPLNTVFSESRTVYDTAVMHLPHLVSPENESKDHPALLRRQVRQMVRIAAGSTHTKLCLGSTITFSDVSIIAPGQRFRIAEIQHVFGERGTYSNSFVALADDPLATPAPVLARRPAALPTLRARVSAVDDDENLGRIKVKFPEADYTDESPFLPVLTSFTGQGGVYSLPEIGDEVLVLATNGALEKSPVVVGAFYSAINSAANWQNNDRATRGFQSGNIGVFVDQNNGKLTIKADEVEFIVNNNMDINVNGNLTQKANLIQLNP